MAEKRNPCLIPSPRKKMNPHPTWVFPAVEYDCLTFMSLNKQTTYAQNTRANAILF